jgi:hypothetical protein
VGTALRYEQDLDFSKPLSEQWGGRFLTQEEVDAIHGSVKTDTYEYVAMNIEHLHKLDATEGVTMTGDDLVALLELSQDLDRFAELFTKMANTVRGSAWGLWEDLKAEADAR